MYKNVWKTEKLKTYINGGYTMFMDWKVQCHENVIFPQADV